MGYDRCDSFPFDFESNGVPFGSKLKAKLSPRPYPIQFERKWKYSSLSVELSINPKQNATQRIAFEEKETR